MKKGMSLPFVLTVCIAVCLFASYFVPAEFNYNIYNPEDVSHIIGKSVANAVVICLFVVFTTLTVVRLLKTSAKAKHSGEKNHADGSG